ncbi:MAG TPA: DMT family transporter, partial [bacterium]|nr:DMT family transporter [bacterium]
FGLVVWALTSGAAGKTSVLTYTMPFWVMLIAWPVLRERPSPLQWGGIALTFVAIALSQSGKRSGRIGTGLILMFLAVGCAELSNKVFQQYALPQYKELFLFAVFFTAFLIATAALCKSRQGPFDKGPEGRNVPFTQEFFVGLAVGVPNLFSSYFLIQAFATLKASVVFPFYSAGSIALITVGGVALFGERPTRRELAAIAIVLAAIVLMGG